MKIFYGLCAIILLSGCATSVSELRPISPPENSYAQYNCTQLEKVCNDRATDIRLYAAKQDAKLSKDSTKMALNLLLLPVFWNVGNDDNTAQLQAAMGYYQEASKQSVVLNCGFKTVPIAEILQEYGTASPETTPDK